MNIKQCKVIQLHKEIQHKCEESGHEWTTYILLKKWEVMEPFGITPREKFNSEVSAIEYAEFKDAFNKKFPFNCPRTIKESQILAHK